MSNFRPINRDMDFLMPPSVDEWLPQRHLARFVVEVIEGLDLRAMTGSYRGSGEASSHPRLLLGLIILPSELPHHLQPSFQIDDQVRDILQPDMQPHQRSIEPGTCRRTRQETRRRQRQTLEPAP